MSIGTFNPLSLSYAIAVTTASQAINPALINPPNAVAPLVADIDYRFTVVGTQPVFVAISAPGATAPTAVMPVAGTPQSGLVVAAGDTRAMSLPYGTQFAVIAANAGSTLYYCAGNGANG